MRAALLARLATTVPLAFDAAASHAQLAEALELARSSADPRDRFSVRVAELYLYGGPAHKARAAEALLDLQRMYDEAWAPFPPVMLDCHRALTALQDGDVATMERALERCEASCREMDGEGLWHIERFRALSRIAIGHATMRASSSA